MPEPLYAVRERLYGATPIGGAGSRKAISRPCQEVVESPTGSLTFKQAYALAQLRAGWCGPLSTERMGGHYRQAGPRGPS